MASAAGARGVAGRRRDVRFRRAEVEDERQVADAHLVVLAEQLPPGDRPAVEERAVAAVEVLDVEIAVDIEDPGVLAADGARFQHDIAGGVPAEDDGRPFQGEHLPRIEPLHRLKNGHADTLLPRQTNFNRDRF